VSRLTNSYLDAQPSHPEASGSSQVAKHIMESRYAQNAPSTEGSLASLEAIDKRVADAVNCAFFYFR
jgi:hypothetical protein